MIVGIGLDLQRIDGIEAAEALRTPGPVFSDAECRHAASRRSPASALACGFAAKEAFFKSLPEPTAYFWTDMEVLCDDGREARFRFHGDLAALLAAKRWEVRLSLAQGGGYASAFVAISTRS